MNPWLFEYAGIGISAYSFMMAVGTAVFFHRSAKDSKTFGLDPRLTVSILIAAWISAWFCARLFFVVEHRSMLPPPWWNWITAPNFSGFSLYGGVAGGIAGAVIAARALRVPIAGLLDAATVGGCLFGAVARIGCFLAGCCYGLPVRWGVVFPPGSLAAQRYGESVAVHPTELYESAVFAIIAAVLVRRPLGPPGQRFSTFMIAYASARFFLSILRGDALVPHGVLSPAQWSSLAAIAASACFLLATRRYLWRTV